MSLDQNPAEMADVRRILLNAPDFLDELGITASDVEQIVYGGAPPPRSEAFLSRVRDSRVKHVGEGHYAHAFVLPSGLVLKVTLDPHDAQAAELVRKETRGGRPPPGLPRVEMVRRLPGGARHVLDSDRQAPQPVYAIVVEPITPINFRGTWGLKTWLQWMANRGTWRTSDALEERQLYTQETRGNVPAVATDPEFALKIDEALQGVKWFRDRGFNVLDLHAGNFGETRDGRTVLFDFGDWSKTSDRKTVPIRTAKNPATVDMNELRMGIEVEQEHTDDLREAEKIAMDHLREFPDYYTRLTKMEARAKAGLAPNASPNPLPIDNNVETGIGATGFNQDADYFGLRVLMRPSIFHRLTLAMTREQARSVDWMKEKVAERKGFGAPALYVDIPDGWDDGDFSEPAIVNGHEGRNRMWASRELYGDDDPVETHIFPRGGRRNRNITAEWIERMNRGLVSERRRGYVQAPHRVWAPPTSADETKGPLFEKVLNAQSGRMSGHAFTRNPGASMTKVHASFNHHFDEAEHAFPDLGTIELHEDDAAGSDNGAGSERQFGYCADEKPIVIAFAPKAEELPKAYIDGLMAHEFGHAIEFRYGRRHLEKLWGVKLPESIERRADKIAEHTFGRSIEYGNLDIQCIGCGGKKTRPRRLG